MSSASKAWGVAASIGAVEALKDQLGFCRWNHLIRSAQQYARNNGRAISRVSSSGDDDGLPPAKQQHSSSTPATADFQGLGRVGMKGSETEDGVRTVLFLSCWGPYN
ncbi:hypothetical protein LINPERPRIM_LOCUS1922 [Linum perenne]